MVKALHHFMFVKPSTLHYLCIIHRQNQCHKYRQNQSANTGKIIKYRQNHPFPMIFPWGFIGNGRNVSICSQAKQQRWLAGQAGKVARQTGLTGRAGSECRQHCGSQYFGRQYLSRDSITTSRRARQARQTQQAQQTRQPPQTSQPISRAHGQVQQTILQKRGRQLGVSWSSPAGGIRLPGTSPTLLHRQLLPHRRRRPLPRLWCSPGRLGLNITNVLQRRRR